MRSAARRGDRGIAMVELSIVVPIFLLLFGGVVEWGMTWRTTNRVTKTVRASVLEAARHPEDRQADQEALFRIEGAFGDSGLDQVAWVIVYRAGASNPAPPNACVSIAESISVASDGIAGTCNVYGPSMLANLAAGNFSAPDCVGSDDRWLCPETRDRDFGVDDRLGVAIKVEHRWLTGAVPGGPIHLTDHSVAVLAHSLEHP